MRFVAILVLAGLLVGAIPVARAQTAPAEGVRAPDPPAIPPAMLHPYQRFRDLERIRTRRLDQIDFTRPVTDEQLVAAWGEADVYFGSGLNYRLYEMANGEEVTLVWGLCIGAAGVTATDGRRRRLTPRRRQRCN